jgi:hypothetical protein
MNPTKVVFADGSMFVCTTQKQLDLFLSRGWKVCKKTAPTKREPSKKQKKA